MSLSNKIILDELLSNMNIKLKQERLDGDMTQALDEKIRIVCVGIIYMICTGIYISAEIIMQHTSAFNMFMLIFSLLATGMVFVFAAFCYVNINSLIPKGNSTCAYIYVYLGKYWAFNIIWVLLLECMTGMSFVAKISVDYLDSLVGDGLRNCTYLIKHEYGFNLLPNNILDFLAVGLCLVYGTILILDMKQSSLVNSFMIYVNLLVVSCFIVIGAYFTIYLQTWNTACQCENKLYKYLIEGSLLYFYAYIGYNSMMIAGKEAKISRSIPQAIAMAISMIFFMYLVIGVMLIAFMSYWTGSQFTALLEASSFLARMKWLMSIGIYYGMWSSFVGSTISLLRIFMNRCYFKIDFIGLSEYMTNLEVCITWIFANVFFALIFSPRDFILFSSIGTMWMNIMIAASMIMMRCQPDIPTQIMIQINVETTGSVSSPLMEKTDSGYCVSVTFKDDQQNQNGVGGLKPKYAWLKKWYPIENKTVIEGYITVYTICCAIFSWYILPLIKLHDPHIKDGIHMLPGYILMAFLFMVELMCLYLIGAYMLNPSKNQFVPFFLSPLSIFFNVTLLVYLPIKTMLFLYMMLIVVGPGLMYFFSKLILTVYRKIGCSDLNTTSTAGANSECEELKLQIDQGSNENCLLDDKKCY